MTQLVFSAATVAFGARTVVADVSAVITRGDRWGIVGRNGSGKTSLFRLITGELEPARGTVSRVANQRVAVLDQHREFPGATTVWDAACAPYGELLDLEHSIHEQGARIGELGATVPEAQLERYGHDLEHFRRAGGYEVEARVAAVLHGLGFDPDAARTQALGTLSGGERGRLGLACQLVMPADILLLDEPTNHLDLATSRWLEDHLRGLDATVLCISHDRAFLDAVVDHVLHLEGGTAFAYAGGYARFVEQRTERRLAAQRAFDKQAAKVAAEEDFIRRNIAGQKSDQAKGRRRRLVRLPRLSPPPGSADTMAIRFTSGSRGGDQVLVADRLRLVVGERVLVNNFSGVIRRGDVVGLVGPNGAGKSTLLAAIAGERPPDAGSVRWGDAITVSAYRQDLSQVPRDGTLFDIIHDLRPAWTRGQVLGHLGRFDFSADETRRRAGALSGGELARVALAMMMLGNANVLVFDEPTNHLDVESIEALEDAVESYEGTVLLVSHDRALLRTLCTRVWHLEAGRLTLYDGTYEEWEAAQAERERAAKAAAAPGRESAARAARAPKGAEADRKARQGALRAARRRLEQSEERVHALEARLAELGALLANPALYAEADGAGRAQRLAAEQAQVRAQHTAAFDEWARASEQVEALAE